MSIHEKTEARASNGGVGGSGGTASESGLSQDLEAVDLQRLGYTAELKRNRSMFTLLFQSLAIAAAQKLHGSEMQRVFKKNHPGGAIGMVK